ncbi:MAG: hypothetical protein ACK5CE_01220, partial [Actinomycetes bacterium]
MRSHSATPSTSTISRPCDAASDGTCFQVDYATLIDDLSIGDRVVIGDGAISLRVEEVGDHEVVTR